MKEHERDPDSVGTRADGEFRAGQTIDEFTLVSELGKGGMGVVWEAEQASVQRRVALKLLWRRGLDDTKWIRRFEREAQACGRLDHPGIVVVHDYGQIPKETEAESEGKLLKALLSEPHTRWSWGPR